ncbi:MAG: hypothetical protein COT80_02570 [Candidatus Buchananbacteria bacterium CG10_big_fil_rev_8_21_14_0_10_33_19]|uniref:Polymerase nucleotidyl transferase domain-containing protein n=1 Tax=Candidatus Buchananbacteria bacterium CG10_big_fil_rev_8_21_14_0_10_33_19 TaxID=1974525 RepID=A0A2H0W416_9BACT|nr:MAG: hypothetical protein COT80_02570 [Candidatus Buchananbacteria bacterium CG10_big_fil_rev_8_21_14_0_10_33_19]
MYNFIHKMNNIIFGEGKGKILECFYRNRYREMYFSEILRETKLTPNTTLKHLKNLKNSHIIVSTKEIGNTFYRINSKNPEIYSIFSFFDYERFNGISNERKRAITEFIEKIKFKPLVIVIFGSTAKGTFGKNSDIDILLIYNKKEFNNNKLKEDIEATTGIKIQTFIIDFDYFKKQILTKEDNVIIHAIKTGFVMSGHDIFYKEVLNE